MEVCFRCERDGRKVRLLDAIYENEMIKVCENCSLTESMPVLRKPTTSQLMESERSIGVSQRLRRMAGLAKRKKRGRSVLDQVRELDEVEEGQEKRPFNLVENFHWEIARARRNKGLSPRQLGWALGESETAIKMVERAELPAGGEKLIRKLEQFFQIKLRERTEEELREERIREEERKKFRIPRVETEIIKEEKEVEVPEPIEAILEEPEVEMLGEPETRVVDLEEVQEEEAREEKEKPSPAKVLTFKPEVMDGITISDLKEMKEEKDREDRLAAVEEERKKALQADSIVQDLKREEKRKRDLQEQIVSEMKDIARGTTGEPDKKKKEERKEEQKDHVPTIAELMERKKEQSMVGNEIELTEEEKLTEEQEESGEEREEDE